MTCLAFGYVAVAYWYFRATLRNCQIYDSTGTVLLNAALALAIGPLLIVPAFVIGWITRG